MKSKASALLEVKTKLSSLASHHTPEGTDTKSVVDQWLHALANNQELYLDNTLSNKEEIRKEIRKILVGCGLKTNKRFLFELIHYNVTFKPIKKPHFSFIDLFAGIGGMRLGFQQAGGVCVFSSEFDKFATSTYKDNYGDLPFGDITKIEPSNIPYHDVLLAGFPCQPFSHAGLKMGLGDTRGTLFHDITNIISAKKPKVVVLENVRGLISHDFGNTIMTILRKLTREGYSCNIPKDVIEGESRKKVQEMAKKMILKSTDFGIPQNRQRIYIILWLDGLLDEFSYPEKINKKVKVGDVLEDNPDPKLTISDKLWAGHKRRKENNLKNGKGFGYVMVSRDSPHTSTISARYYKDGSEILIEQEGSNPRKISPREAARLQGFPDSFIINKSNTQAYKQFGNSVTVPVVLALAKKIKEAIFN